ncbi:MAG: prephenate dehydratase [Phycisphaerae bacterium]|nr:prephenate dehydratase [Phycisphaerae bacterium]
MARAKRSSKPGASSTTRTGTRADREPRGAAAARGPGAGASGGSPAPGPALDSLRTRIDRLDERIILLLNQRSKLVVKIGAAKRASGTPIYAPHREAEVLQRVLTANRGPLKDRAIEGIYRELMSGSFALEQPLRIGYLGPAGSHSHVAAVRHFGTSVEFDDLHQIAGVFTEVQRGHVDYGLAPIENSIGGSIVETMDAFRSCAGEVHVCAEVQIEVHHALLANCAPAEVRRIHSKPEVFAQCRTWLATQYPKAELVPAASSSRAVITARDEHDADPAGAGRGAAAVGTALAGDLYGMNVLFERIEDNPNNITRFFVISRHPAKRSGADKTSMMFTTPNTPGALVSVLAVFQRAGINLTHIDKRPSGRSNWQYTFFIDAEGHGEDPFFAAALAQVKGLCQDLTVLGSYPRSKRIL